jgi:DNA-directed RNA polymerase sigma subunit (sigma70/sigma32)
MFNIILQKSNKDKWIKFDTPKNREIYLKFTGQKDTPKRTAVEIANEYDISRQRVYKIVRAVETKLSRGDMSL